jgi:transcriptional regulator with XRE-family HTH domain
MENIGKRLKILRTELALKQGEFAEKLGISQEALSDFEREFKPMAEKYYRLICLTFGVNEDWLRFGEGEMFNKEAADTVSNLIIFDDDGKPLNYEEGKFINTYRRLTDPNKEVARTTVDALLKSQDKGTEKREIHSIHSQERA